MIISKAGCKLWTGALNSDGYGVVRQGSKLELAHRAAIGYYGPKTVHHTCHNRRCVNPAHLKVTGASVNSGETSESMKEKCKYGHSLKDAYASKDGEGRIHRQCRTCKMMRERGESVSKHLEGRHDQKLHGNWAAQKAGGITKARLKEIRHRIEGKTRDDTMRKSAQWLKAQDSSIPMAVWIGSRGQVLDVAVGSGAGHVGRELPMNLDILVDKAIFPIPKSSGLVAFPQDRLQRLWGAMYNRSVKGRPYASTMVVKGRSNSDAVPTPADFDEIVTQGMSEVVFIGRDGSERMVRPNYDKIQDPRDLSDQLKKSIQGHQGRRVFHEWQDRTGGTIEEAKKIVEEKGFKALGVVPKGKDLTTSYDEAWEVVGNRTGAYAYYKDRERADRHKIPFEFEKAHDDNEKYAALVPDIYEVLSLAMREEHRADAVAKHLLGQHDQSAHGRRDKEAHSRDDHDRIKRIRGKLNFFRDETKDPDFGEILQWERDADQYESRFPERRFVDHYDQLIEEAKEIKGAELNQGEKERIRRAMAEGQFVFDMERHVRTDYRPTGLNPDDEINLEDSGKVWEKFAEKKGLPKDPTTMDGDELAAVSAEFLEELTRPKSNEYWASKKAKV